MTAFRIFTGFDSRQTEAIEVFAYSVQQHTSIDVEMLVLVPALTGSFARHGITAFTFTRFLVPHLCGYEGRALFCDGADMLCLGDVRELAEWDMQGKPIWVVKHPPARLVPRDRQRSWTSLMLLDCSQMQIWTPDYVAAKASDDQLMFLRDFADEQIGALPEEWNYLALEGTPTVAPAGVKLLHWSYLSHPTGGSWIDRSQSPLWAVWREHWRAKQAAA